MSDRRERRSRNAARRRAKIARQAANRRPDVPLPVPPPGTRRVDVGGWQRTELLLGGLLPLLLGLAAEIGAVFGLTVPPNSTPVRIVLAVLGLPFLAAGLGLLGWRFRRPPVAVLDVDDAGLRLHGRTGVQWQLTWADVTHASVVRSRARPRTTYTSTQWGITVALPRHFLVLTLPVEVARRLELDLGEQLAQRRSGSVDLLVNLGLPSGAARRVIAALGPRCDPPQVRRERAGELPQELY